MNVGRSVLSDCEWRGDGVYVVPHPVGDLPSTRPPSLPSSRLLFNTWTGDVESPISKNISFTMIFILKDQKDVTLSPNHSRKTDFPLLFAALQIER